MVLAVGQKVQFYGSTNLLAWEYLSEFGSEAGAHGGVWECPDLFPLKAGDRHKWVLIVNINPGAPNGGSGVQYFIGDFDGNSFINDNSPGTTLWLDYGPDNYAGVTWSDVPPSDGRRIFIGWMNNWSYAQVVPTVNWRSAMTLPRTLHLQDTPEGFRLCSRPVKEMERIRQNEKQADWGRDSTLNIQGLNEISLNTILSEGSAVTFGFKFSNGLGEQLIVGFNAEKNQFFMDRTQSGKTDFSGAFTGLNVAPRISGDTVVRMQLYLDHSSLELFADNGLVCMTSTFFPNENFNRVTFFQSKGVTTLQNSLVYDLKAIW
jgi:fructan beta-fructosidase